MLLSLLTYANITLLFTFYKLDTNHDLLLQIVNSFNYILVFKVKLR